MLKSNANLADQGPVLGEHVRPSFSAPSTLSELPPRVAYSSWFTNSSVVFREATSSRSREKTSEHVTQREGSYAHDNFSARDGEDSEGLFAEDASKYDGDLSSQPLSPYVGMVFDTVDDARKFYNDYAFKLGFGTNISTSKFT
ncbi:Cell division control 48-E-like protein [Hordeum vulgare]|nr:Cell division control 48-E-like protein [Hordeum vulgare]